jgi:hypothetical protein
MTWLAYIAAFFVFLSYWKIPTKPLHGWAFGVLGNLLYVIAFWHFGKIELELAPVGFTALTAVNLWRSIRGKSSN